jgi:hypothetical protein
MSSRTLLCGVAAALGLLAIPASVMAAPKEGSLTDPAGDAAPQRDITDVKVSYDRGGIVTASVTLTALPDASAPAIVAVRFGEMVGDTCAPQRRDKPVLLVAGTIPSGERSMAFLRGGAVEPVETPPQFTVSGTTVSIVGKDRELADRRFDCSSAAVGTRGGTPAEDDTEVIKLAAAGGGASKKLRRALKRCRKLDSKRERKRCVKRAHARFGD